MSVNNSKHSKIGQRTYYLGTVLIALGLLLLIAAAFLIAMIGLFLWHYYEPINGTVTAPMLPAIAHEQATEGH